MTRSSQINDIKLPQYKMEELYKQILYETENMNKENLFKVFNTIDLENEH